MATNMNADQAAIARKVQEFKDAHDVIDGALTKLRADADTLTANQNWQGGARDQFKILMDTYSDNAKKLNNELMDTADKLNTMGAKFDNHDQENASRVKQIMGSLDLPPN